MNLFLVKIKEIFKEHYFYKKDELIRLITYQKPYSNEQIDVVLNKLVTDKTEIVEDRYGRGGNLINIGDYYIFQPLELDNKHESLFARNRPIEYKREKIILEGTNSKETDLIIGTNGRELVESMNINMKWRFNQMQN